MREESGAASIHCVGEAPAVAFTDVVALYDPRDGEVVHLHQVITLEGAPRVGAVEQEESAIRSARRLGVPVDGLSALHVPDFCATMAHYRVDTGRRTLVEEPFPGGSEPPPIASVE